MLNKGDGSIMPQRPAPAVTLTEDDYFPGDPDAPEQAPTYGRVPRPFAEYAPEWEELTEVEGRFLLRYDGKVYAAVEVPADSIIAQAFAPRAES